MRKGIIHMEVKKTKIISQITILIIAICSFLCPLAKAEDASDYISYIYIYQVWDYGDPTDSEDLMYEFNLEVNACDSKANLMNAEVSYIEFVTPVGYTFQIAKQPDQLSGDTWTSYEYTPDNGGEARWKYKARFSNMTDLFDYNNGVYTIKLHMEDGGQFQTTALFIISQPTQEPILISPENNQTLESPVTFSWEKCTDLQAKTIWIDMEEQASGTKSGTTVGVDVTNWGPVNLIQGAWEMEILFAQYDGYSNGDGIWVDVDKYSKSTYTFSILADGTESDNINISKSIVEEGPFASGDTITYKISIDTLDLSDEVTDVYLIDNLPDEVNFVSDTAPFGFYDEDEHRYVWISSTLAPGTARELLITVQINPDVAFGTEITNSVSIDSDGKPAETASVSFTINKEAPLLEIEDIQVISGTINRDDISGDVTISMGMPEGILLDDINTEVPILLDLGDEQIAAYSRKIEELNGKVRITVVFDTAAVLNALPGYGQFDVEIIGQLNDGRIFSGQTVITIAGSEVISEYISKIHFEQTCNYENLAQNGDETYEFYFKISAESDRANNMNTDVNSIEVSTPVGNIFHIPKLPDQMNGDIWTSYEYEEEEILPGFWIRNASWEYRVKFSNITDLQNYGDGQYTITLHYNNGSQSKTTAWFGTEDSQTPLAQPPMPEIKEPNEVIVELPITFSWEYYSDSNVSSIWIGLEEKVNGGKKEKVFNVNETSWGPIYLASGRWEVKMILENSSVISDSDDGIDIESYKYSQSKYDFVVINYLTNTYEVWGGDIWINPMEGSYGSITDLKDNNYKKLSADSNNPGTFTGEYNYYVIATKGQFLLDSIQGSDGTYYYKFGANTPRENIIDENFLLGMTDGLCATIGDNNPLEDFSGWLVFENPDDWEGITVTTRKLNISKKADNTPEELENISSGDMITYMISFDSSEMLYDVNNVTIIDYLPNEVSFVSADNNEVYGIYDANDHAFIWLSSSLSWGSTIKLPLTVKVNMGVAPDTIITNFVTIDSNETPATVASASVTVSKNQLREAGMQIVPETISRYGIDVSGVMVILALPSDVSEDQVNKDELLVLTLDSEESGKSVIANEDQDVRTYEGIAYVLAVFDKTRLLNYIQGSGKKKIKVEGKLIEGSFVGWGTLTIN